MNDDDLRQRFRELREEEQAWAPRYVGRASARPGGLKPALRYSLAFFVVIIISAAVLRVRHPQTEFTAADRVAARRITEWRAPTDSLLPKGVPR